MYYSLAPLHSLFLSLFKAQGKGLKVYACCFLGMDRIIDFKFGSGTAVRRGPPLLHPFPSIASAARSLSLSPPLSYSSFMCRTSLRCYCLAVFRPTICCSSCMRRAISFSQTTSKLTAHCLCCPCRSLCAACFLSCAFVDPFPLISRLNCSMLSFFFFGDHACFLP